MGYAITEVGNLEHFLPQLCSQRRRLGRKEAVVGATPSCGLAGLTRGILMLIRFLAVIVTGLAVIAPAAHFFELPGKIHMSEEDYFVVQRIYLGWWVIGLFLPAAFVANLALAVVVRHDMLAFWLAVAATALIVVNLAIFIVWTQPANAATENWAVRPENWQALRRQWEYSHAVNAGVTFLAFCAATLAALHAAS
jgi:hypothetical protein